MLTVLRLFVLALLMAAGTGNAAVYKYNSATECSIISKNLRITVFSSTEQVCSASIPTALGDTVEVSYSEGHLTLKQIKPTTSTSVIALTIPAACKLSCHLTKGSDLTILNNGSATIAPVDITVLNGGTVSITHGNYASCNLTILGFGDITLNDVETTEPLRVYINGFGTLHKSQQDFNMGGMNLKNGALVYFGPNTVSAGKRTACTPEFSDISIEDLTAYAAGKKQLPELPNGWAAGLSDKERAISSTPASPQKTQEPAKSPTVTTAALSAAQELLKAQADLETKARAELEVTRAADLKRQELAEDQKFYGTQIRGLSYQQVKAALLDESVIEGVLPKELFRVNGIYTEYHPFSIHALANRIKFSTATDEQKRELWTIFLFKKIIVTDIVVDDFKRVTRYVVYTPNSLWGYVGEATTFQAAVRALKPWVATGFVVGLEGWLMWKSNKQPIAPDEEQGKSLPEDEKTSHANNQTLKPARSLRRSRGLNIAAIAAPIITFLYFYGKSRTERINEQTKNLFFIKTLEACVERIFIITNEYKDVMPPDLVSFVNAFNNKESQLKTYSSYGTIDIELFKIYHAAVCNFYNELGRKAGLVH